MRGSYSFYFCPDYPIFSQICIFPQTLQSNYNFLWLNITYGINTHVSASKFFWSLPLSGHSSLTKQKNGRIREICIFWPSLQSNLYFLWLNMIRNKIWHLWGQKFFWSGPILGHKVHKHAKITKKSPLNRLGRRTMDSCDSKTRWNCRYEHAAS